MKKYIILQITIALFIVSCSTTIENDQSIITNNDAVRQISLYEEYPEFNVSYDTNTPYSDIIEYAKNCIIYTERDIISENSIDPFELDTYMLVELLNEIKGDEMDEEKEFFYEEFYNNILDYLNSHPLIEEVIDYAVMNDDMGVYISIEESSQNIVIANNIINKLDILRQFELNTPLDYRLLEDKDEFEGRYGCNCPYDYSSNYAPQKALQYVAHAKWPKKIRYRISNSSEINENDLVAAMSEWAAASNNYLTFSKINNNYWNRFNWTMGFDYHISVKGTDNPDIAGSSTLGCVPWATIKFNKDNVIPRTYLHELGHTLGLMHEHQRPDRDCYVEINWDNIKYGYASQFWKGTELFTTEYCIFDYESIMMYSSYACTIDGTKTIDKKNYAGIDYPTSLSSSDITAIQHIYN